MSLPASGVTRFEGYEIDRARWQLRHGENVLPLNRKTFDLLLYLVDNADRVVTKDELLRALWPGSFIEESNLTQQVFLLRKALAKYEPEARIVETVPGRGYRFAVRVHSQPRPPQAADPQPQAPADEAGPIHPTLPNGNGAANAHAPAPAGDLPTTPGLVPTLPVAAEQPAHTYAPRSGQRAAMLWAIGSAIATALLLISAHLFATHRKGPHLSIAKYTRITHDGHAKSMGGTDGSRIYFTRLEKSSIAQIPIAGGGEALIRLAVQEPWSGDVSPDGSTLLIVSQAGGQGPASSLWALELVTGSLHRLGNAISSAWSPDGKQIVCASAGGELWVMRRDGSDPHRIAAVGGNISFIAWAPDGRILRFSRDGLLWEIAIDGTNPHQLLPGWSKSPTEWSGQWSPDGTYFFVADGQIWTLDDGKTLLRKNGVAHPVQLTYGPTVWDRPLPTPDGKKLLASGRTDRGELVRFDPDQRQSMPFLGGLSAEFVTFSDPARSVAYVSFPEGILWRANPDGSNPVPLTEPPVYPKSVRWSPDGSQLAFVDRTADSVASIFTIDPSGTHKAHRLLPEDHGAENDPSWSPDGRKLVFSTSPNVGASSSSDLRVVDLDSGKTSVLPGSETLLVPRWSPDGQKIAAMTVDSKGLRIFDLATGRWSSLDTGAVAFPEWSHDSKWIYYVRWTADPTLVRIRAADGHREVVADLTGGRYTGFYTLWMGLDSADNPLMLRDTGADDIYALTLQRN